MSTLSLRLPDSLHSKIREFAAQEGISINQFIATAAAEKMASLMTVDYLRERAERGDRDAFEAILAAVPDVPPSDPDTVPDRT